MFGQYYSCNYNDFQINDSTWGGVYTIAFQIEPTKLLNFLMEKEKSYLIFLILIIIFALLVVLYM